MSESYFLASDKSKPLSPNAASLNDRLQTQHLNVPEDDSSWTAGVTRQTADLVGSFLTPKQVLGILRVLKAATLAFLVLTLLADTMYMLFCHVFSDAVVKQMAGGNRDLMLRLYGLVLASLALAVELDVPRVVKRCSGLKPFVARALFYLFIALLTGSHPINVDYSNSSNGYGDDAVADDAVDDREQEEEEEGDDAADDAVDDAVAAYDPTASIPKSAVGFQMVTSFVLALCALGYLICGMLCLDRFTARAFLSSKDPRVTTAIPPES